MNDLHLYIDFPLDMYADDSTIHVNGKTLEELESKLNIDFKMYKSGAKKQIVIIYETC